MAMVHLAKRPEEQHDVRDHSKDHPIISLNHYPCQPRFHQPMLGVLVVLGRWIWHKEIKKGRWSHMSKPVAPFWGDIMEPLVDKVAVFLLIATRVCELHQGITQLALVQLVPLLDAKVQKLACIAWHCVDVHLALASLNLFQTQSHPQGRHRARIRLGGVLICHLCKWSNAFRVCSFPCVPCHALSFLL